MRAHTWILVAVLALGVIGCEQQKKDEELPQIDPAELEASAPPPEPLPAKTADTDTGTPAVEVETPSPMPPATTAKPSTGTPQTYTMQRGDTLYSLAKRFYGDGKLWTRIADANKDKVRDVTDIPVGTVLTIPSQ
ncbi:MAG: LysM peptidoglycan-binding domain-containing protein [Phycisphaerae bacterium]